LETRIEETNLKNGFQLLCMHSERPRSRRRAAEQRYELAPFHSMTSSARQ
jgi:hypothetical protein